MESKSGLYKGPSHAEGGIPETIIETGKPIEVEGTEYRLCPELLDSDTVYTYKGKTNFEILEDLHKKSCKFTQGKIPGGSGIIRKSAVLDDGVHDRTGTAKEIANAIQAEHNGRPILADGGMFPSGSNNSGESNIFANNLTKDEIKNVLSGKSEVRYGTTIQAAARYIRGNAGTDYAANPTEERGAKREEETQLKKFISLNNLWVSASILGEPIGQGSEQKVFRLNDREVVKVNDAFRYNSWIDYFHSLLLNNLFFADTAYELLGFMEYDGLLCAVVKQCFVRRIEDTSMSAVRQFMSDNGFIHVKDNDYFNPALGIKLEDLHESNILTKRILYFIDTVFYITDTFASCGTIASVPGNIDITQWEKDFPYIKKFIVLIPTEQLDRFKEFDRRKISRYGEKEGKKYYAKLKWLIEKNGITTPLALTYGIEDSKLSIGEGNHRLAIAQDLNISFLPVYVKLYRTNKRGIKVTPKRQINYETAYYPNSNKVKYPKEFWISINDLDYENPIHADGGYIKDEVEKKALL